jgi:hypothetical protein
MEPTEPHPVEPAVTLARDELLELYKIAVEEYRFQVRLNADRSRDFIVLNSAIIAAAITLLGQARLPLLAGMVFLIGLVVAVLSALGTHTQHGYYRDARNRTAQLEERLGIRREGDRDLVLYKAKPTGSRYRRFGSITNFNYIILGLLCLVDLIGAFFSFGVIPSPKAPAAITQAAPGQPSAAPRPRNVAPAPPKRSSSGLVRPSPATPPHP